MLGAKTHNNIIEYNVFVHSNNLRNNVKVQKSLQYLLQTPIDYSIFQKYDVKKSAEKYQKTPEFREKSTKLVNLIEKFERANSMKNVFTDFEDLEIFGEENQEFNDPELDKEIQKVMMTSSDDVDSDEDVIERPTLKLFTDQCEDSPRHQSERISLWEKIRKSDENRTTSPLPGAVFGSKCNRKLEFNTPRFCPIKRQVRFLKTPLRDRNLFDSIPTNT